MSFYRPEVFQHKKSNLWGEVLVAPTRFYLKAIGVLCLSAFIGIVLLVSSFYFRKETVTGVIEPKKGIVSLYAPNQGYVSEISVNQGDTILRDTILLKISDRPMTHSGENFDESFKNLLLKDSKLLEDKAALVESNKDIRLKELSVELSTVVESLKITREQKDLGNTTLASLNARLADLVVAYEKGAISSLQMKSYESEARAKEQDALAMEEKIISLQNRKDQLEIKRQDIEQSAHEQQVLLLQQKTDIQKKIIEFDRHEGVSIYSPNLMKVTQLNVKAGQYVQSGTHLFNLEHPTDTYIGVLHIPESSVGFVEEGMVVNFRLHAYPYEHYGILSGKVEHISRSAVLDSNTGQYFYKASVSLDEQAIYGHGREYKLRHGLVFDADIKTQKITLIDKILEPLKRFKKL